MSPDTLHPGALFAGEYRICRPLAEGGMGRVYLVEQLSTGRRRARKLMRPSLVSDRLMRRRFAQEARVAARIESAHIVDVIAAGVDGPSGVPWIAMELLSGRDLRAILGARGHLTVDAAHAVLAQLCHGLAAAHAAGIVHRDLKPENVFVVKSRRLGAMFEIKILDFGIAKLTADATMNATQTVGTPLWMAPEQTAAGAKIEPSGDVWALGLLVFRMLTGACYWRCAAKPGAELGALLREVTLDRLVPASERAAALGAPARLPRGFDDWFARCVTRDLRLRFREAGQAFAALEPILLWGGRGTAEVDSTFEDLEEIVPDDDPDPPRSATVVTGQLAETPDSVALPRFARAFDTATWESVTHESMNPALADLLAAGSPALPRAMARRRPVLGAPAGPNGTRFVERAFRDVVKLLAIERPQLRLDPTSNARLVARHGEPMGLTIGDPLLGDEPPPHVVCALARYLAGFASRLYAPLFLGSAESLRAMLRGIFALSGRPPSDDLTRSVVHSFEEHLRPWERKALEAARQCVLFDVESVDLLGFLRGAHITAARVGLLASGSVSAICRDVTASPPRDHSIGAPELVEEMSLPRFRGHLHYAAFWADCNLNSNSIGLIFAILE